VKFKVEVQPCNGVWSPFGKSGWAFGQIRMPPTATPISFSRSKSAEEGFDLSISRDISTAVGEDEIDLSATQRELVQIRKQIRGETSLHNAVLK